MCHGRSPLTCMCVQTSMPKGRGSFSARPSPTENCSWQHGWSTIRSSWRSAGWLRQPGCNLSPRNTRVFMLRDGLKFNKPLDLHVGSLQWEHRAKRVQTSKYEGTNPRSRPHHCTRQCLKCLWHEPQIARCTITDQLCRQGCCIHYTPRGMAAVWLACPLQT